MATRKATKKTDKESDRDLERLRTDFHQSLELLARAEDENETLTKEKTALAQKVRAGKDTWEEQQRIFSSKHRKLERYSKELTDEVVQLRSTTKALRFELDSARSSLGSKDDDFRELRDGFGQLLSLLGVDGQQDSLDDSDRMNSRQTLNCVQKAMQQLKDMMGQAERQGREQAAMGRQQDALREEKRGLDQKCQTLSISEGESAAQVLNLRAELERVQLQQVEQQQQQQPEGYGQGQSMEDSPSDVQLYQERKHHLLAQLRAVRAEHELCESTIAKQEEQLLKAREVFTKMSNRLERRDQQKERWAEEKHQFVKTRSRLIGI
jgi:chromosome segregation ATPase